MRLTQGNGYFEGGPAIVARAARIRSRLNSLNQILYNGQAHALDVRRIGKGHVRGHAASPVATRSRADVLHLRAIGYGSDAALSANDVDFPSRNPSRSSADKGAHAIVKDEIAVALRVGLALGRGVRFHFAKNPLDLSSGHVAHNVDEVAAIVRQATLGIAGNLEDLP